VDKLTLNTSIDTKLTHKLSNEERGKNKGRLQVHSGGDKAKKGEKKGGEWVRKWLPTQQQEIQRKPIYNPVFVRVKKKGDYDLSRSNQKVNWNHKGIRGRNWKKKHQKRTLGHRKKGVKPRAIGLQ